MHSSLPQDSPPGDTGRLPSGKSLRDRALPIALISAGALALIGGTYGLLTRSPASGRRVITLPYGQVSVPLPGKIAPSIAPRAAHPSGKISGILAGGSLTVRRKIGTFGVEKKSAQNSVSDSQLIVHAKRLRDAIELALPQRKPGQYELEVYLIKATNFGEIRISINGAQVGGPQDLYSTDSFGANPVDMGRVRLKGSGDVLRLEVIGKNAASSGYEFAFDGLALSYLGSSTALRIKQVIEGESLVIAGSSHRFPVEVEVMPYDKWSSSAQLSARAPASGDWVDLMLPDGRPGKYEMTLYLTKSDDYGIVQVLLNGKRAGAAQDLYAAQRAPSGAVRLGTVELKHTGNTLRIQVIGKNSQSTGYAFGLDALRFRRQ